MHWLIYLICLLIIAGILGGAWWFGWHQPQVRDRKISRAIQTARWEQSDAQLTGGKIAVEIVRIARWGDGPTEWQMIGNPERIAIVTPDIMLQRSSDRDPNELSYEEACEAADVRMAVLNATIPDRR